MLKEIWNYLLEQVRVEPEVERVESSEGRLSVVEAQAIAQQIADKEKWDYLEPREIQLWRDLKDNKLFWDITFLMKGVEERYVTGTQAFVNIDDETSEIIKKGHTPR